MAKQSNKLYDWLGLNTLPDITKARWLGGFISVVCTLLIATIIFFVSYNFISALIGLGEFKDTEAQSNAIRNTGLVVAAIIGVPFVIWRTAVAQKQANTAIESLFNEKINAASVDLHAMRQRWDGKENNIWEDDIVRRNVAIDRLEGLANERPDVVHRISLMLSVYVRELSKDHPAKTPPENASPGELKDWAQGLSVDRPDMEHAVQVLGRLREIKGINPEDVVIDLRKANLQRFDLSNLNLEAANLEGACMQGAFLSSSNMLKVDIGWAKLHGAKFFDVMMRRVHFDYVQMQGADFNGANLQGAYFAATRMEEANLSWAKLQGTRFNWVKMQGADLTQAKFQGAYLRGFAMDEWTSLRCTLLRGAALTHTDCRKAKLSQHQIDEMFYDGSATLSDSLERASGRSDVLVDDEFFQKWESHQESIGFDPDDPSTWDEPNN